MFFNSNNLRNVNYISLDEISSLIQTHQLLIDLRSKEEYNQGHIKGFINIPYPNFYQMLPQIPHRPLYLLCQTGKLSSKLANELNTKGYQVYSFIGGFAHYKLKIQNYF